MSVRRLLLLLPLLVLIIAVGGWYWLLHTQSGARWVWAQVEAATDGSLSASDISGAVSSGLVARGIRFAGEGVEVNVAEVSLAANVDLLPMRVTVLPARVSDLLIDLSGEQQSDEESDLHATFAKLQLPVELVFTDVELERGAIEGIGDDLSIVVDTLSLAGRWEDEWFLERFAVAGPLGSAEGNGRFTLYEDNEVFLEVALLVPPELTGFDDAVPMAVTVQGPLDDLVGQGRADRPRIFWHSRVIGITDSMHWELRLEMPSFELPSAADTVRIPPVDVIARAQGDESTFAAEAELRFRNTDMQVKFAAEVDVDADSVSGNVEWDEAHWPVGHAEPQVHSRTGQVVLSGSLDNWRIAGSVDVAVPQLPPGSFTIDGGGDLDGANIRILDGDVFGGSVAGSAEYSWREAQPFAANLDLNSVQTATVLPEWPATLSGKLDMSGQAEPFEVTATLSDVRGEYRSRPLRADGSLEIQDGNVSFDDFRVTHGETLVRADGALYATDGLQYEVAFESIGDYVDDAFGSLTASGSVSLRPGAEFLRLDASATELGWRDFRLTDLSIVDQGSETPLLEATVSVGNMTFGTSDLGQLHLRTNVGRESQDLDVDVQAETVRAGLTFAGKLDSWDAPSSWTGAITRLEFEHTNVAAALDGTADISITTDGASIDHFCLVDIRDVALCVEASWDSESGVTIASDLSSVPVDTINAFFDTGLDFEQVASGDFRWQSNADGTSSGRGDIAMTPGRIVSNVDPELYIDTGPARLGFYLDDDDLRSGILDIPFPGLGQIAAEFELLDVADEGPSAIQGLIDVDLEDVGLLIALFPIVDSADGILRADLAIGGTSGDPLVSGDFALENGALTYLPAGLKLDEIELQSELQANGEIELTGSFRAGEGRAEIRTRADHARTAATGLELTLRGNNLTLIDVPDVRAIADADLRVNFDGQTLDMNGNITIPHARVQPANISSTRIFESEDVVIVAGELPDDPDVTPEESDIEFAGSVQVELGDDVVVDLDVTKVYVTGSTVFSWAGEPIPNALGRYDVDGEIVVFGQRLDITEGSVRFADEPADDPYLRIRAEREIFGNTEVRRAGVLVAGNLSRPTIEPYTNPVTTEERALTLLVTGSDFDIDKGVGAIDFGTYVAPRVFVSYGISLFEDQNVIRVRYDLKRGFGVTGTSGGRESGVDLSYRFEN